MRARRHRCCIAAAIVAVASSLTGPARAAGPVEILFTADTEGHLAPEAAEAGGGGGIARRAAFLAAVRRERAAILLLDGGNALFGPDSVESRGKAAAAAYDALAYDAVNVSYRDFRLGKAATLAALEGSKFVAVSANLLDGGTGAPLFKPYTVLKAGVERIAVIGLTEEPAAIDLLPHLKAELAGIRVAPPADALAAVLPRAKGESDRVVLLYYGSLAGLRAVTARHGADVAAVLAGGLRPEFVPADAAPPVIATEALGAEVARCVLTGSGAAAKADIRRLAVDTAVAPDPAVEKLIATLVPPKPDPLAAVDAVAPAVSAAVLPETMEAGKVHRLDLAAENRGVRLSVLTAELAPAYSGVDLPAGRQLLILVTEWENIIPLTDVQEKKLPTEYRVPNLADNLYLVAGGTRVERLLPKTDDLAGHVPVKGFRLERIGSRIRGNILFPVSAGVTGSLDLRFYDYAHGHMAVSLRPRGAPEGTEAKPISPPLSNEVLEAAAYGIEKVGELDGRVAPAGMEFLAVDFRARSLFVVDADATAFDPKAKPGARVKVGNVADWLESRRYAQLVADGEHAYAPLEASTLVEEPRFLPDIPTGGRLCFLVPAERASLELRCDFPNAKSSLDGRAFRPQGLTIPLEGRRPQLAAPKALIGPIADDPFQVVVTAAGAAPLDPGPAGAERLVLLDVTATNAGKKGEFLQTVEQLQLVLASGKQVTLDPAAAPARPALPLLWVPAGERRSFTAGYRVPAVEAKLRLAYRGATFAKTFDLPPLDGTSVAAAGTKEMPPAVAKASAPGVVPAADAAPAPGAAAAATPAAVPAPAPGTGKTATPALVPRPRLEPKGLAGVGLTAEEVNAAIDRGADFLWKFILERDIKKNRGQLGGTREHSIASLALVHAGAHKRHADFQEHLRAYLNSIQPEQRLDAYQAGIVCMLIETYGDPSYLSLLESVAQYLLELQGEKGSWSYSRALPRDFFKKKEDDRVLIVTGGHPLEDPQLKEPRARRTDWKGGVDGDNSTSQYALLGLHAASRSGMPVDADVWRRSLSIFRERQEKDGSWAYHTQTSWGYGSMTCAGICSVALTRHQLGEKDPAADPAIEAGLAWLAKNFSLTTHPKRNPPEQWRFYYLYSLERVGRVLDADFIGLHEWYPLGARNLVDSQSPEGGWVGKLEEVDPRLATSFALLFLTRATPSLKPVAAPRGGDGTLKTDIQLPRGSRYYFILDASGSMTGELDGKTKWEIARGAVSRLVEELPDNAEVGLRVYGHRKRAIEDGASEDTALEVPLKRLLKKEMLAKLESLKPRGKTPMARSLLEARRDLGSASAENPVTVVLLTDGGEDTLPRQDPVAAAAEMAKLKGIRFHIVGFDIGRDDWKAQLETMAAKGEGRYWPARSAESLLGELRSAVFGVPEGFTVVGEDGKAAGAGRFGDSLALHEGRYVFRASYAGVAYEEAFWINTAATTSVVFNAARVAGMRLPPAAAGAAATRAPEPSAKTAPPPAATPEKPAVPSPASRPKFCTDCGTALGANAKFCAGCGKKIGG